MLAYIYAADLWCNDCGEMIREQITREGHAPEDPNDEYTYDSDEPCPHLRSRLHSGEVREAPSD